MNSKEKNERLSLALRKNLKRSASIMLGIYKC